MKKHILFFSISILLIIHSCQNSNNVYHEKPIKKITNKIGIIIPPTILTDSETCFKFFVTDNKFKIKEGYINCNENPSHFDIMNKTFLNCNELLVIEKDTVIFWLTATKIGLHKFQDVRLILQQESSNNYFYLDTSFNYNVQSIKMR